MTKTHNDVFSDWSILCRKILTRQVPQKYSKQTQSSFSVFKWLSDMFSRIKSSLSLYIYSCIFQTLVIFFFCTESRSQNKQRVHDDVSVSVQFQFHSFQKGQCLHFRFRSTDVLRTPYNIAILVPQMRLLQKHRSINSYNEKRTWTKLFFPRSAGNRNLARVPSNSTSTLDRSARFAGTWSSMSRLVDNFIRKSSITTKVKDGSV